jgi:hypothetical protein
LAQLLPNHLVELPSGMFAARYWPIADVPALAYDSTNEQEDEIGRQTRSNTLGGQHRQHPPESAFLLFDCKQNYQSCCHPEIRKASQG